MNSQDIIKKLKLYPVASVAGIVTIALILAIYWRGMSHSAQQHRHEQAVEKWNQIEENVFKNSVNLETHLENAKLISHDVKERLIRSSELAKNYQYFYRFENSTGVKILTLQQQPTAPRPPGKKGNNEPKQKPQFSKVGYTMSATGGFHQTLAFLHAIEHGQHFFHLKEFALQRSNEAGSRDITITMNFDLLGTP